MADKVTQPTFPDEPTRFVSFPITTPQDSQPSSEEALLEVYLLLPQLQCHVSHALNNTEDLRIKAALLEVEAHTRILYSFIEGRLGMSPDNNYSAMRNIGTAVEVLNRCSAILKGSGTSRDELLAKRDVELLKQDMGLILNAMKVKDIDSSSIEDHQPIQGTEDRGEENATSTDS